MDRLLACTCDAIGSTAVLGLEGKWSRWEREGYSEEIMQVKL